MCGGSRRRKRKGKRKERVWWSCSSETEIRTICNKPQINGILLNDDHGGGGDSSLHISVNFSGLSVDAFLPFERVMFPFVF